jgi:hypothetical protein
VVDSVKYSFDFQGFASSFQPILPIGNYLLKKNKKPLKESGFTII